MNQLNYIGTEAPRPDAPDKAAGKAMYIHDMKRPGMLYGKIKFSDHAHARIKHIDTSRAEKLPGVRAVITGYDTPPIRIGFIKDNVALKRDKVRQFRDEVAAVAATDPDIAAEAIDLIQVEYEPIPGVFSPTEALKEGAPIVHETDLKGRPKSDNIVPVPWRFATGDVEQAKASADFLVEEDYKTPLIQQSCMGTAGCIAEFDLQSNLIIRTKTQIPFLAQNDFNQALRDMGLKGKRTRVIVPTLGGSFGTGLDTHGYEFISILLAYKTGRPVKIVFNREEEFTALSPRQPTETHIIQGCDREGRLVVREIKMILDNGAYTSWGATTPSVMMIPASSIYRVPNVLFETTIVYTNNTYCQAMRGYGNPQVAWAMESNMDQLAEKAGMDPFELRRINSNIPNETTPMGLQSLHLRHEGMPGVGGREPGLAQSICGKSPAKNDASACRPLLGSTPSKARGVGMAALFHVGGSGRVYRSDGSGVILKIDDFGDVSVVSGGVEMGQGFDSALALATAEALGVSEDHVKVVTGDTATCPWDVGTHASRGAFTSCNAAILAAEKARKKIFILASEHFMLRIKGRMKKMKRKDPDFEIPDLEYERIFDPSDFDMKENRIFLKDKPNDPVLFVTLEEILRAAHYREQGTMVIEEAFYDPPNQMLDPRTGRGNMSSTYIVGAQGAEVEVDLETGRVEIVKMAAAHDVGQVINQQTIKGQIYGGLAQGIGYALCEEYKTREGKNLNPNFLDYKIMSAPDLNFPVHIDCIETHDKTGPFGAKGVGEPGLVPTAPAIANAVYDAIGVRIRDLPITPEKVLKALEEKRGGE